MDITSFSKYCKKLTKLCLFRYKYIFLFGGLCDSTNSSLNNQIEKLDITKNNNDNKWEIFNINSEIKLPFYSGVVKINNNELFLLGGNLILKNVILMNFIIFH